MIGGMTTVETKREWGCGTCGLRLRNPKIGYLPLPSTWDRDDEGHPRCSHCRREASGELAQGRRKVSLTAYDADRRRAADEANVEARAALMNLAPAVGPGPVTEVAEALGLGRTKVEAARRELRAEGKLPPAANRGGSSARRRAPRGDVAAMSEKRRRVEDALRRDHERPSREIAEECRVARSNVYAARKRLGLEWNELGVERDRTAAALASLGEASTEAMAEALGVATEAARQRLNVLVEAGRAERVGVQRQGKPALYRAVPGVPASA